MAVKAITAVKAEQNAELLGASTHPAEADPKQRQKALLAQVEKRLDNLADDLYDELMFELGMSDAEAAREMAEMAKSIADHYSMAAREASH